MFLIKIKLFYTTKELSGENFKRLPTDLETTLNFTCLIRVSRIHQEVNMDSKKAVGFLMSKSLKDVSPKIRRK